MKKILSLISIGFFINLNLYADNISLIESQNIKYSGINYEKLTEYFSSSKYAVYNPENDLFDISCPTSEICTAMIYRFETNSIKFYNFYGYTNSENNISYITVNLVNDKNEIIETNIEEYIFRSRKKRGLLQKKIAEAAATSVSAGAGADWAINKYGKAVGKLVDSYIEQRRAMEAFAVIGAYVTYQHYVNGGAHRGKTTVREMSRNNGGGHITSGRGRSHSNMAR